MPCIYAFCRWLELSEWSPISRFLPHRCTHLPVLPSVPVSLHPPHPRTAKSLFIPEQISRRIAQPFVFGPTHCHLTMCSARGVAFSPHMEWKCSGEKWSLCALLHVKSLAVCFFPMNARLENISVKKGKNRGTWKRLAHTVRTFFSSSTLSIL